MKACVLGATGFIGGQIALAALAEGWQVRAARRNPSNFGAIASAAVQWVMADLRDEDSLTEAMRGCEIAFHAAAGYPENFRRIPREVAQATQEMQNALNAARRARINRFVYTSSLTTLEPRKLLADEALTARPLDETSHYTPGAAKSAYYEAKWAMETLALAQKDLDVVVTVPTAVMGPGDVKPTTSQVIRDCARGLYPVYFDAVLNPVDGRDVARAHIIAAQKGRAGERYILGGQNMTMLEMLTEICRVAQRPPPKIKLSRGLVSRLMRVMDAVPFITLTDHIRMFEFWSPLSDAKARRELGHTSRPFAETVKDYLDYELRIKN